MRQTNLHSYTNLMRLVSKLITNANSADAPKEEKYWLDQLDASMRIIGALASDGVIDIEVGNVLDGMSTRSDAELQSFIVGYHQHAIPNDGDTRPREYFLGRIQNCALRHVITAPEDGMDHFNSRMNALQQAGDHRLILI